MSKTLRVAVLSGALMVLACPVFAQSGSDPGGGDPPPPPPNSGNSAAVTTSSATATAIATLLAYLGL